MQQPNENKMGHMPVNKLILEISLPMMISMLVQALYNIVDSMFVSQLSERALTAVSLAFPIQSLMIALGAGTGVGVNALLSKSLGEREFERANKAAKNGIFLVVFCYIIFLIVGIFAVEPFYISQLKDVSKEAYDEILSYGTQYLSICCIVSIGMFSQMIMERLLQSTGKTIYSMYTQALGAIINVFLDPILIFGLLGAPKLGIAGAAVATVFGQTVGALLALYFNVKKNKEININMKHFKPDFHIIGHIYAVGLPSIIMQAIGSVMVYGMNRILIVFTDTATTVFGVYFKLNSFIFMPVFGLTNGMIPVAAYNFGAGNRERLVKSIKIGILYAVAIMTVGMIIFLTIPELLLSMFKPSETMIALGVPALRIISLSFPLAGFCIISGSLFQALGKGVYSMIISVTRQLVVLLPSAYLLSLTKDVNLVWWSYMIAEVVSLSLTIYFLTRINNKIIKNLVLTPQVR